MSSAQVNGPLAGVTVLVTRAKAQAAKLVTALEGYGATVLAMPVIRLDDPPDWEPVDTAIAQLDSYDWVVFSSANAVERFVRRVQAQGATFPLHDEASASGSDKRQQVAAVGPATARRCRAHGIEPDYIPDEAIAEGLIDGFEKLGIAAGARVLIPRALKAREVLPQALRARGVVVDVAPVYRTLSADPDPEIVARIAAGEVQCVTFTSPSTVRGYFDGVEGTAAAERGAEMLFASIGPVTTAEIAGRGFSDRIIEAPVHTARGLAEILAKSGISDVMPQNKRYSSD